MIHLSSVLYLIGAVGGSAGVYATLTQLNSLINGPVLLFVSIAILWVGLMQESIEADVQ